MYSKTCVKQQLKIDKTKILMTNGSLMKVESSADCSPWNILQYLWPALSDNWSWKPIFGLCESGCFTQTLLYVWIFPLTKECTMLDPSNSIKLLPIG